MCKIGLANSLIKVVNGMGFSGQKANLKLDPSIGVLELTLNESYSKVRNNYQDETS